MRQPSTIEPTADQFVTHQAGCKLCRQPLLLRFHVECPETNIANWTPMATCDRCFDYVDRLRQLSIRIDRTTRRFYELQFVDETNDHAMDVAMTIKERLRTKLTLLTKKYAEHVCKHWRKTVYWEPDFVDQLAENPLNAGKILALYVRMVRRS